ncbi:MAG: hypothetical protein QOH57_2431 [Mycobacterium sp.]|jgi:DeoR/GlpR family transcriptional regulator of sugar metabolism|nr:hypothetical protein [Mycobacterium sp.]
MTPDERRATIAKILEDCPEASQRTIADAVGCSQATVARDTVNAFHHPEKLLAPDEEQSAA